jgi:hypothetical protein
MYKAILVTMSVLGCSQLTYADAPVIPAEAQEAAPAMIAPSVAKTKSITFLGESFEFKDKVDNPLGPMYEFFIPSKSTTAWDELVSVGIYTPNLENHGPKDYATNTVNGFKQRFPKSPSEIFADTTSTRVIADVMYPISTRADGKFMEFDAFLFYTDPVTSKVMNIHYAKNIALDPYRTGGKPMSELESTITNVRQQALKELMQAKLYTP